ncbi:MAG TPA: gliding motility lipoprotein GldH [Chitinophagaceae bacterium]|nr:gliding motility lipoprotein GldH [Chitinophagaceae bacterium]
MKRIKILFLILTCCTLYFLSCTTIDLYEKEVAIPGHEWKSSFKPVFTFTIKDTTVPYQFFLVLRHTEKYNYTNIYVNLYIKAPGTDSTTKIQRSLMLADNNGWLGSGMDDIYEHRIPLGEPQSLKAGTYTFTLEQIMREDPLEHVLNVGLRLEKKQ